MKTNNLKACVTVLCVVLTCSFNSCSKDDTSEVDAEKPKAITMAEEILQLVNAHRTSIGKAELALNTLANTLAYEHTLYMIDQEEISHDKFDERSKTLIKDENASRTGENVAYGQRSAKAVMKAWLNSSGHRKNIEGDFTHVGIAVIKTKSGIFYYTQLFLKKRADGLE